MPGRRMGAAMLAAAGVMVLAAPGAAERFDPHQSPPNVPRNVQDWLTPQDRKELRERPEDSSVQLENPPVFGWKSGRDMYSFEVAIERNGEPYLTFVTTSNIFRPDSPLPPGAFNWRVRQLDQIGRPRRAGDNGGWSVPRTFNLREDSITLQVPDIWTAFGKAETARRPRALPPRPARLDEAKQAVFDVVLARYLKEAGSAPAFASARGSVAGAGEGIARSREVRARLRQMIRRMNDALAVSVLHPDEAVRDRAAGTAAIYLEGIVGFDAFGRTGHAGDDLLNIRIAKAVARAYDILYRRMDPARRAEVQRHVEFRTQAAFDFFLLNDRGNLGQFTLSSHGFQIATHVLAIAALMAGDSDRATLWFRDTYPLVSTIVTPWGGDDGGYSNGVNYGVWEFVNHVDSWDVIHNVVGFPYFETAWVRNFAEFLTYFAPPGVSQAGFGDGAEKLRPELWAEISRLYVERGRGEYATALLAAWRAHLDLAGGEADELSNALLWPRLFGVQAARSGAPRALGEIPDAAIFPDIGWAAIHSDLPDPERYSILFKSSQFGSFSHSHADQNSFMVMGQGRPLLIDSGYYDGYRSAHHNGWTRRTVAHNAITYDGGKGQPIDDPTAKGRLTDYWRCGGAVKLTGRAARAYGGDIVEADRTLLHLPGGLLLVHDRMAAGTPKRWEWNFHAAAPIHAVGDRTARIRNGPAEASVELLVGPPVRLELAEGFPEPPNERLMGPAAQQYHGVFAAEAASAVFETLALVRIGGGAGQPVTAREGEGGGIRFEAGRYSGSFAGGRTHLLVDGTLLEAADCAVPPRTLLAGGRLRFGRD